MNRKKKPYWKDSQRWVCPNHAPAAYLPRVMPVCWYEGCGNIRPYLPVVLDGGLSGQPYQAGICSWEKCNTGVNGGPGIRLPKRKYCSHECRKKKARHTYVQKKKAEKGKLSA